MKILTATLMMTFFLTFSVFAQSDLPKIKARKKYTQTGVELVSPNQSDWRIEKSESLETRFAKTDSDVKVIAFVKTRAIDDFENVEDLFVNLENLKQDEIKNLKRDSIHYNRTNFKETECLQYDGVFDNDAETDGQSYKYFNLSGYLCRHPAAKNTVIQLEFFNYSNLRGFSEAEVKLSKEFFEKIKFVNVKTKK